MLCDCSVESRGRACVAEGRISRIIRGMKRIGLRTKPGELGVVMETELHKGTESGEGRVISEERRVMRGERRAESGERRAESGERRAESGER